MPDEPRKFLIVQIKSQEQQAGAMLLTVGDGLVKQRTTLINAIRGHAAEFGITAAKGACQVKGVLARAEAELPALAFRLLSLLGGAAQEDGDDVRIRSV